MNVPSIEESEAGWLECHGIPYWPQKPLLRKWTRKVLWMGAIILAPEVGVAMATRDFLEARKALAEADHINNVGIEAGNMKLVDNALRKENSKAVLSKTHAFMANMCGFKVKLWILNAEDSTSAKPVDGRQQLDEIVLKDPPEGHFVEGIIVRYQGLGE